MSRAKTIRETYFDPNYAGIKYINEDTTLYALKLHGYISSLLENRLESFTTIGEVIDTSMSDLKAEPKFGAGSQKELTAFFKENHSKFRLKGHKATPKKKGKPQGTINREFTKKLRKYEKEIDDLMELLTAHKSLETTLYEEIETLKTETEKTKRDYDKYYQDRIRDFEEKIKVKDLDISTLKLYNVEAFQSLQEMRNKIKVYEELKTKINE
jgi:hypothetical protein|tara:strand:- start:392 stop:1027 length:636 start_codon:yes stop_codon:yes gene_type:complete